MNKSDIIITYLNSINCVSLHITPLPIEQAMLLCESQVVDGCGRTEGRIFAAAEGFL
jgi:hypothetical protein